ncbi:hypothetical protein GCM10009661_19630 [Catellatospora chokoriensis]|uniref:Uncharacterized protein n=1 Tax=Catellatospora chokoriensis TaxID=310353 RepID=A0A8J3JWR7_9ACTN|nr:hypothetical protein Cch02nite_59400 [Catellatospora chokoriensis]
MTDHGSMRLMLNRARRGPREAAEPALVRAARTASVTRTAPALALLTTERSVEVPAAARPVAVEGRPEVAMAPVGSESGAGMPAGRVKVPVVVAAAAAVLPADSSPPVADRAGVGSD